MRGRCETAYVSAEQRNRNLYYRQPSRKHVRSCSTVVVSLDGSSKRVSFEQGQQPKRGKSSMVIRLPAKSERMATKGTQTDYRESETQTLPWKHPVKVEGSSLKHLLSFDWLSSEKHFPLGMDGVRLIEATRQQLAWEDVIKRLRGAENERKRRWLVTKTTDAEAELRESRKEAENQERLEISRRQLKEAKEGFEEKLRMRLLRSYGRRWLENDSKIGYWRHQLTRRIRKMKSARSRSSTKPDIVAVHGDKASDLYAPKLRHGQSPSLRHEVIDIQCRYLKRFHGLEILEKHLFAVPHPKPPKSRHTLEGSTARRAELCPRMSREKVVAKPSEMKFDGLSLRMPVAAATPGYSTPATAKPLSDSEENLEQASLLLKRLIRGRAVQTDKFVEMFRMMST